MTTGGKVRGTYLAALLLAACKRDEPDPTEPPPPPDLPVIDVDAPARGAFVTGDLDLRGSIRPGDGRIVSFTVNEAEVDLQGDAFDTALDVPAGIAVLSLRVEDDLDQRAVDGRAAQVGPVHEPGATIADAIQLQLNQDTLDDDAPDLDDIASLGSAIARDPGFARAMVGVTYTSDYYDLVITGNTIGDADMDIDPREGVLGITTWLYDVDTLFDADVFGFVTVSGSAHADAIALAMDLTVATRGGEVTVTPRSSSAAITGFSWEVEWVPSFVEDLLRDDVQATMEEQLAAEAEAQIGTLVEEALAGFAFEDDIGTADEVRVTLELAGATVHDGSIVLVLDGRAEARRPIDLPANAGSLRTDAPVPRAPLASQAPLVTVVDDDFVNQVLFAFWAAGDLGGIAMSGVELSLMTGNEMPPPLGPVGEARIDVGLPPVITPPTGELPLDLSIGEMVIAITRDDGEQIACSLNIRASAEVGQDGDGGIAITLDDRPANVLVAAGILASPEGLDPGDIASLFRLSTPTLLGRSSSLFPSFPTPELPIGEMMDSDALAGVTLGLGDLVIAMDASGAMRVEGRLLP